MNSHGRKHRILLAVVLVAALVVMTSLLFPKRSVPEQLKMPDGSELRVLAVTFGTNHIVGTPLARWIASIKPPMGVQKHLSRWLGDVAIHRSTTIEPTMIVWLDRSTNGLLGGLGGYSFAVSLADTNGFISGGRSWVGGWQNPTPLYFTAFPRRASTIVAQVFSYNSTGGVRRCGALKFANPVFGKFPQWQPEQLPATRRAGDVEVTLEKFTTGHDNRVSHKSLAGGRYVIEFSTNRVDRNQNVCFIGSKALVNTNQFWRMVSAELSDANGNKLHSTGTTWGGEDQFYFAFEPGLWPDEAAWKLRCEIKRFKGFAPEEVFVFKGAPLGELEATNSIGWTTNLAGVSVTFDYLLRRPVNTNSSWSADRISVTHFIVSGLTNDVHLDLIGVLTDTGAELRSDSSSSSESYREYDFRDIPPDARTADFSFAVHHSRWVEFQAKPEIGPARLEYRTSGSK